MSILVTKPPDTDMENEQTSEIPEFKIKSTKIEIKRETNPTTLDNDSPPLVGTKFP